MTFYLYINGNLKSQTTYAIKLEQLTVGYSGPWELTFTQHKKFDQKSFDFEDTVRLETHSPTVIRFEGNIKQIQCVGSTSDESIKYVCLGLKKRLEEIILEKSNDILVEYNVDGDTTPDQVGTVIKDGLDAMMSEITSRISGFGYTAAELNAMTVKVPADTTCKAMNMMQFVEFLLNYQPTYRCYIHPNTKKIIYVDMDSLTAKSINVSSDTEKIKSSNVRPDVSSCYTKVKLQGPHYIERVDFYDPQNVAGSTLAKDSGTQFHSKAITSDVIAGRYDPSNSEYHHGLYSLRPRFCRLWKWDNAPVLLDGDIDKNGVITFDIAQGPPNGYVLLVRYTYHTTPIEAESAWSGTAYSKGVMKILAEYTQDCKKLELKGRVTYVPGGGNLFFYDASMWLPTCSNNDPLELNGKTITVGAQQKTITSYTESRIYLNNVTNINAGDDYSVASRDEVSDLEGLRDEVKDLYKDIQYIESIVLGKIDFDFALGKKVRLTNTNDSDFLTYAPIIKVVYNLLNENTIINLTQDAKLQLNEALRRLLAKRKKEQENEDTKVKKLIILNFYKVK